MGTTTSTVGVEAIAQRPDPAPSAQPRQPELDVIFSSRDGYVWASWAETDASVRLGRREKVANMMRDFLAQEELGERLAKLRTSER